MSSTNNTNTAQIGYQWKPTTKTVVKQQRQDFSESNSNDKNGISLCIRFAFKNITPGHVFNVMKNPTIIVDNCKKISCSLGFIERVDHIFRRDGNKTYFIHFRPKSWNFNNDNALDALEIMTSGRQIEIVNDDKGHFWKVSISKAQRPIDAQSDNVKADEEELFPDSPFIFGDFSGIDSEVATEIAALTEQNQEEKSEEKTE